MILAIAPITQASGRGWLVSLSTSTACAMVRSASSGSPIPQSASAWTRNERPTYQDQTDARIDRLARFGALQRWFELLMREMESRARHFLRGLRQRISGRVLGKLGVISSGCGECAGLEVGVDESDEHAGVHPASAGDAEKSTSGASIRGICRATGKAIVRG